MTFRMFNLEKPQVLLLLLLLFLNDKNHVQRRIVIFHTYVVYFNKFINASNLAVPNACC